MINMSKIITFIIAFTCMNVAHAQNQAQNSAISTAMGKETKIDYAAKYGGASAQKGWNTTLGAGILLTPRI